MIHAKELRFGNKVMTSQGEVITIQQILSSSLIYDTQIKVNREVANIRGSYSSTYTTQVIEEVKEVDLHDVMPIELNADILTKCGFRNYIREEWIFGTGKTYIDFEFTEEGLRLRQPIPSRVSIKYFHQLQNFLYSLIGFELDAEVAAE